MITTSSLIRPRQPDVEMMKEVCVDLYDRAPHPATELLSSLDRFHPNILIIGSGVEAEEALEHIRPTLRAPWVSWSPTETPRLPTLAFGTLMVRGVDCLTPTQQASLAGFLRQSAGDRQIVSIARLPLFPLVRQGRFVDELYYRLNVVLLDASNTSRSYDW